MRQRRLADSVGPTRIALEVDCQPVAVGDDEWALHCKNGVID
jgi:hypothetical protein